MSSFVDTNVLVRHLVGDPPDLPARATAYLRKETGLPNAKVKGPR